MVPVSSATEPLTTAVSYIWNGTTMLVLSAMVAFAASFIVVTVVVGTLPTWNVSSPQGLLADELLASPE